MSWWTVVLGLVVAVLAVWLVLVGALIAVRPNGLAPRDAARLLPDVLRLFRRLATDSSLPRGVRVRIWLLLAYLALPIDLIPDFLPVIGYADDAIVTLLVLRSVVRRAGARVIEARWPGTPDGLTTLHRLTGLTQTDTLGRAAEYASSP
jgi:uncharacterized membrane protein YkvA (DUF1232 family)